MVNQKRVRTLKTGNASDGPVLYWMSRDQRAEDNWALAYAIESAENKDSEVWVVFTLLDGLLGGTWRQFDFMMKGLKKLETKFNKLNIPFIVLKGHPGDTLPGFIAQHKISRLVTDFDPLRVKRQWKKDIMDKIPIRVDEVDAHNIIPCWLTSDKEEYGAYTIRPKILKLLPEFLDEFSPLIRQNRQFRPFRNSWEALAIGLSIDHSVQPVDWLYPGEEASKAVLERFLKEKITNYRQGRNDPNADMTSNLSAYIRFGQLSCQRIALEVLKHHAGDENAEAFLEELIVRRELADNFCYYNIDYDRVTGFRPWALESLEQHRHDKKDNVYSTEAFENATTHDPLWNAAQLQLRYRGTMNGYMRMYTAL